MSKSFLIILFFPLIIYAQSDSLYKGIRFEKGLSWQQMLDKAKVEGKYVFVDCYATWCLPCKWMDKNIYTSEKVYHAMLIGDNRLLFLKMFASLCQQNQCFHKFE